jgi:hypothetical protein
MQLPGSESRAWWEGPSDQHHARLMPTVTRLRDQAASWREAALRWIRMYGKYSATGAGPAPSPALRSDRLRYNICSQAVDTLVAEIAMTKPKVQFMVEGDWTLRQAAQAKDLLIEAQMRENDIYGALGRKVLRDSMIPGAGLVMGYVDMDELKPKCEQVMPFELLMDQGEARYGCPRSLVRHRLIDRAVLIARFPKHEAKLRDAPRFSMLGSDDVWLLDNVQDSEADLLLFAEGWHLPSSKRAKDGRYVAAIEGLTLASREYKRQRFPFPKLDFTAPQIGFWGVGVIEELAADQVELNRVLRRIQDAAGVAAGIWVLPAGQKLKASSFTDVPGACVETAGAPPQYYQPQTVPRDLIDHAERIITRALRRLGISEQFASAQKSPGLDSGAAIRAESNIYSQRQNEHTAQWEQWHVAVAQMFVDLNEDIAEIVNAKKGKDDKAEVPAYLVEVARGRRKVLKKLRWEESSLPENEWSIQAYPMGMLPREPAGRIATIQEWIGSGLIDAETAKYLLDLPDTEGVLKIELADYDFALFAYETMVEDGEYVSPEPYQKFELAFELMRKCYLRGVMDGVPESRLDLVRDHMEALEALKKRAASGAQASAPAALAAVPGPAPEMAAADPMTMQVAA